MPGKQVRRSETDKTGVSEKGEVGRGWAQDVRRVQPSGRPNRTRGRVGGGRGR